MKRKDKNQKQQEISFYIEEKIIREHRNSLVRRGLFMIICAFLLGCAAGCGFFFVQKLVPKKVPALSNEAETKDGVQKNTLKEEKKENWYQNYENVQQAFVSVAVEFGSQKWVDEDTGFLGESESFGIIIAESFSEYYILTEAELLKEDGNISVSIGGEKAEAYICGTDSIDNVAIISVDKEDISKDAVCTAAVLGSSRQLSLGDVIIAAGSPYSFRGSVNYGHVVYMGDESATDHMRRMVYTDMACSLRSSGVLLNTSGEVVAWITKTQEEDVSNFIAGSAVEELALQLLAEEASIPYLGVCGKQVSSKEKEAEGIGIPDGLYLTRIDEKSPAMKAGLQPGDIVTDIDGTAVTDSRRLWQILQQKDSGDEITIGLKRMVQEQYEELSLTAILAER